MKVWFQSKLASGHKSSENYLILRMRDLIKWWSHHKVCKLDFCFHLASVGWDLSISKRLATQQQGFFSMVWGFRGEGCCFLITHPPFVSADNISISLLSMDSIRTLKGEKKSSLPAEITQSSNLIFLLLTLLTDWGQLFEMSRSISHLNMFRLGSDCSSVRLKVLALTM